MFGVTSARRLYLNSQYHQSQNPNRVPLPSDYCPEKSSLPRPPVQPENQLEGLIVKNK